MGRTVDPVEAFQQGYKEGQAVVVEMINRYCGTQAENIQQLIQAINAKVTDAA
jgi:hypothetical protein